MKQRWNHFIDGRVTPPKSGRYLDEHDPVKGEKIGEVAAGDRADIEARSPLPRRHYLLGETGGLSSVAAFLSISPARSASSG